MDNCRSFSIFFLKPITRTTMVLCFMVFCGSIILTYGRDLTLEPGHLKPFGEGRPSQPIEEMVTFPNPRNFFENFVKPLKPLKMIGGTKYSPAFVKWTDEYFLQQDEPSDHLVSVEKRKKEDRAQNVLSMSFKDFVRTYNNTETYMVNVVPFFMRNDVVLPCPLQCKSVMENDLLDNVMWFSSGGTKSVVHTDPVDNINCLLRGEKTLVMVDPSVYKEKVDLDKQGGSYSAMDVDSVDYLKYPGMADVEFYHVHMVPGDCLYIPYGWIHQVRSRGSNLAVNVWWRHYLSEDLSYEDCNDPCDLSVTLQDVQFSGISEDALRSNNIREYMQEILGTKQEFGFLRFSRSLFGDQLEMMMEIPKMKSNINMMFSSLDKDKNGFVSKQEIQTTKPQVYNNIGALVEKLEVDLQGIYDELGIGDEENEDDSTGQDDGSDKENTNDHDEL